MTHVLSLLSAVTAPDRVHPGVAFDSPAIPEAAVAGR